MGEFLTKEEQDRRVIELLDRVLEIEQRLIPTGLHIFGVAPGSGNIASLLQMVASFDRDDIKALTDLVAAGLGLPSYPELLKGSAENEQALSERERVEKTVRNAIELFLSDAPDQAERAADWLHENAAVPAVESKRVFELLGRVKRQLETNDELKSLLRALRGEYIIPGPGADIVQNPDVLPTGRNTYAINPYTVPSAAAVRRAEPIAEALLERHYKESGRYPEAIAMVLWGLDNIKTQGEAVAQALWLLGVRPGRDSLNRATGVEVVPIDRLNRPRIDVVMTVSGIFRDLFAPTMDLLDRAVTTVAMLDEPDHLNFVRKHVRLETETGALQDATARVFSNAAGNYGTNVNFMVLDSQWEAADDLADLFITRKCFAFGRGRNGLEARKLMERALERVEITYQNIDSIEVGITDVDHYFEYLGGVTRAVEKRSGSRPRAYLSDTTSPNIKVRTVEETVRLETRTKTLNPKWYEGMLKHGFSGVAQIEQHVTNTFGWSATADAVDDWIYDSVAQTYVLDREMLERLRSLNPDSLRSMVGRLLEASGRGLWSTDDAVLERLREVYGSLEDELEGVAT